VLLVAYDLPPPPPLYAARPLRGGFAAALLLTRNPDRTTSLNLISLFPMTSLMKQRAWTMRDWKLFGAGIKPRGRYRFWPPSHGSATHSSVLSI